MDDQWDSDAQRMLAGVLHRGDSRPTGQCGLWARSLLAGEWRWDDDDGDFRDAVAALARHDAALDLLRLLGVDSPCVRFVSGPGCLSHLVRGPAVPQTRLAPWAPDSARCTVGAAWDALGAGE